MLLWVSIALLTLVVTVAVVRPLFSRNSTRVVDDDLEPRLAVFRDRRDEIGRELAAGRLSESEAEQARADLLRQMAEELPPEVLAQASAPQARPTDGGRGAGRSRAPLVAGLMLAVLVPLLAAVVYRAVGSPEIALAQLDGSFDRLAQSPQAQFDSLVAELEARLRENPKDGEAWAVLAEAYKMIGNHGAAIEAFAKATELLPPNARLLADYAESTALAAAGDFSGRPTELLERALAADPNDQKAVALMGAARYRAGDLPQARRYLGQLLASLPPGSEDATQIGEVVARIDAELAARGGSAAPGAGLAGAAPPGSTGAAPTGQASAAPAKAPVLAGRVELAPAIAAKVPASATLFVIARAAQGPRIPVAVLRVPAGSLPYAFEIGDGDAMDPSRTPSSVGDLVLEARISVSGDAARRPGDLIGEPVPAKPGSTGVSLLIDRVVEP
ncbi:c-type cytochrome biogenesis protein CcmI [Burkholderiaceae bacterium FT117]|uniref:c-type cytochrome biogenesis protein CcmI n=1 Tax=Zeimonas sediminis TaxID=2944268 RepID=UPI002342F565|nr:c-type cytochrome biogenesis protein CcmI [Zeimonas sediminis]MCM5569889.1 c-type cytochrome biogenesis protein CcmI [Zeimonas sediminis]